MLFGLKQFNRNLQLFYYVFIVSVVFLYDPEQVSQRLQQCSMLIMAVRFSGVPTCPSQISIWI